MLASWRRRWDSNPRTLADQTISSRSRYDHFDTSPYLSHHQHLGKRGELMGRTKKNIKLKNPEKPRKIKGSQSRRYRIATAISSQSRYDHFDTSPYLSQHQHLRKRGELMGRTRKNIKLRIPEKPRKIKGFRNGGFPIATTISSQPRYDRFDTAAYSIVPHTPARTLEKCEISVQDTCVLRGVQHPTRPAVRPSLPDKPASTPQFFESAPL